jgi:hypothetical protein
MLLGFYEQNYNGRRIIGHGGDTVWFHSNLHLFLDDNVGLFVSMNSSGKEGASHQIRSALFEEFTDRYLPGPTPDGQVDPKTAAEHAHMMAGIYDNSRRADSTFFSLLNMAGPIKVVANDDGTIGVSIADALAGGPVKWHEIEPFVWRQVNGENLLAAEVKDGRVARFTFGELSPFMVFEPVSAGKSPGWLLPALVAGLLALLLTSLAWPVSALVRRHYGVPYRLSGEDAKAHRWIRLAATAAIAAWIAWGVTVTMMMSDLSLLTSSLDGWLWILKLLSVIVFLGAAAVGVWNAIVVVRSTRKWYAKVWAVVLAFGLLITLWVAFAFHLLSFSVNY